MEIDEKVCLKPGAMLQGGKYKIEKILGQGGFGITYLAVQTGLNRKVAIKEFFMKEHCNRNTTTSGVSIGSEGSADIVKRYREKFVKEAQLIAGVEHKNIVRIIDTFEENNTAYYVMNYHANGSLQDYVENNGPLPEHKALFFIRQLCEALKYIHTNNILHLDVKPSNIMIDKEGNLVLIDFGISKHYDEGGKQTTSTPVGRSKGYAPFEQYIGGELKKFTPASDIYSAAATLLYMLTATRPPEPDEISEMKNDFPYQYFKGKGISNTTINAIAQGMKVNKSERPQTISEFEALLNNNGNDNELVAEVDDSDDTIPEPVKPTPKPTPTPKPKPQPTPSYTKYILGALVVALGVIVGIWLDNRGETTPPEPTATVEIDSAAIRNGNTFTVNGVSFTMIAVKGGSYTMGCTSEQGSDCRNDEKPAHNKYVNDFMIGETEVTQALWQAVMGSNPSHFTGDMQRPVENVSWDDCQTFIRKLNQLTGENFRLPTEAEWEYAARGGNKSKGYKYSGSNASGTVAWYDGNSGSTTHRVKTKQPNELGIYDMSGNVEEWCKDKRCDNYNSLWNYGNRVLRGGRWSDDALYVRVSSRIHSVPDNRSYNCGLRLAF